MSNPKPLIAMASSYQGSNTIALRQTYFNAIYDAGGIPVPLERTTDPAVIARYAADFDGFFFTGGVDVGPKYYGEEITGQGVEVDEARDAFEFALYEAVKDSGKPILGVCRGIQFLNVARGGTLYQHIEGHRQTPIPAVERPQHVTVTSDTRLHALVGAEEIMVNSFHHQAIKELAPGLEIMATAEDGTIEAVYGADTPYLRGYQWHPERLANKDEQNRLIFEDFVRRCGE